MNRAFVPIETEPLHPDQNAFDHLIRRTFDVGVFDSQNKSAARLFGEQPIEQCRASSTNVQITCRRRSKANPDLGHSYLCYKIEKASTGLARLTAKLWRRQ